jgi:hypothetical protein
LRGDVTMPDSASRAIRYRDRAEECRRLADIASASDIGDHYRSIAEHYETLAKAEETLAQAQKLGAAVK